MRTLLIAASGLCLMAGAAAAQDGDAEAGEKAFAQCRSCHSVTAEDGTDIIKGGRVGPNLWGVAGRVAGSVEGFSYSDDMVAAGEAGLEWNQEDFTVYVQDPTAFLKEYTGDDGARGKMTFQLRNEEDAADLWAFLAANSPEGGEEEEPES